MIKKPGSRPRGQPRHPREKSRSDNHFLRHPFVAAMTCHAHGMLKRHENAWEDLIWTGSVSVRVARGPQIAEDRPRAHPVGLEDSLGGVVCFQVTTEPVGSTMALICRSR